jgi:hypothetical protein
LLQFQIGKKQPLHSHVCKQRPLKLMTAYDQRGPVLVYVHMYLSNDTCCLPIYCIFKIFFFVANAFISPFQHTNNAY